MTQSADFYFDYGSPTSYLAYVQMPRLAQSTDTHIHYKPILLGGVFKATNNASPMDVPAKRKWMIDDLSFFANRYGVPFRYNEHFPINTLNLMRGAMYAQREGFLSLYSDAVFKAMWVDNKNMGDPVVIAEVLTAAGIDSDALMAATQDAQIKDALKVETELAIERGLFGAPVLFVGDTLFFGQDRIQFAQELLSR